MGGGESDVTFDDTLYTGEDVESSSGGEVRMTSHLTIHCIQEWIQKVLVGGGCNFELG